jgi:hypothetical protein
MAAAVRKFFFWEGNDGVCAESGDDGSDNDNAGSI